MVNNKKVSIPPIRSIQAFEQAAYLGSIVKAAENLNITASAVSHQIANLESFLNKKLFYRTGRGVILTDTGEKYLEAISGALHSINVATSNIIEKFKKQHENLHINLSCSYEDAKFNLDQVDIDIRHGNFSWKNLNVMPIKHEYVTVLAAPSYIYNNRIDCPSDLLDYSLILSESTLIQWPQWFAYHNIKMLNGLFYAFSFDRSYMSFEAAKQGLGFIIESTILAESYLQQGTLIPVFDQSFNLPINAHYVVFPYSHKKYARVQYFIDWLTEELSMN